VVLVFVGAGAAETDTAGNCSGLSSKGIAEPAMVEATGAVALVIFGAATDPNLSLLSLKGAAEFAAKVFDAEPSFLSTLAALGAPAVLAAVVAAGVAPAADADLPAIPEATLTAPNSFLLSLKGAAEGAAKVVDGDPSLVLFPPTGTFAVAVAALVAVAAGALAAGAALAGSVPASAGRPK